MKAKIKTCISLGCPKPPPHCQMPTRLGEGGLMLRIFLAVAMLTIAGVTHAANIDASVGYAFSEPTTVGGGYGTFGSEFRVTTECTLTHLGTYDHGQDGLAANTPVGLWSSSGILLASTTVFTGH